MFLNIVNIKKTVNNNKLFYPMLYMYRWIRYFIFPQVKFVYNCIVIFCGNKHLKELKKIESGRCFIIGTGPSLTFTDLEKLKNEKTFGVNSLCKAFEKIGWCTTYFGFLDKEVFLKYGDALKVLDSKHIFYNIRVLNELTKRKFPLWNLSVPFNVYYGKHIFKYGIDIKTKFSGRPDKIVYDGYTVLYAMLQIAIYMGFTKIYLLGADCNYKLEKKHFIGTENDKNEVDSKLKYLGGNAMIESYKVAKVYADKHGIEIYNATRGGMLEVFERVNLDDVLK